MKIMNTTILLTEKWRVQHQLSKKSDYNLDKYAELVDAIVSKLAVKYKKRKRKARPDL